MENVLNIGTRRELFVDDVLIGKMQGTSLKLHEPISGGSAICIDRPWEGAANGPRAIMKHQGKYLMFYRAWNTNSNDEIGALCLAISDDAVTWHKPEFGNIDYNGNGANNITTDESGAVFSGDPWYDTRPGIPDSERIKAIRSEPLSGEAHTAIKDPKGPKRLVFYSSSDGAVFKKLNPQPEFISNLRNCFDGGNTLFWSELEQQYVLYYRWMEGEWSTGVLRTIARATSKDLMQWSESVPMTYGESPREQFYTNNTTPYFRAPHIYIAPAARFMEKRRVLSEEQVLDSGLVSMHGHFYGNDCSDAVLLTSRAGSTQYDRTFMEVFIRPGLGYSNWTSRTNYPCTGIFPYNENQMMLFVSRHYMHESWHIERLLLRLDGFSSVNAPWTRGTLTTKVIIFKGAILDINYRTSAAGFVRVEIRDSKGKPIPGFTLDDCNEIIGDEISRSVTWNSNADIQQLNGTPIQLHFSMKDADLYSVQFQ